MSPDLLQIVNLIGVGVIVAVAVRNERRMTALEIRVKLIMRALKIGRASDSLDNNNGEE
jgi:hypothetical protein